LRFLLDTNVVSELRKGERADHGVREWLSSVDGEDLALSVLVLGEIRLGILRLEGRDPRAAARLDAWLERLTLAYRGRTLGIDALVTKTWARLNAARPLPVVDSLPAATALVHGLTFVTRNVGDLAGVEVPLLDPFTD
jgi:predicted nucleic acid-binding protein